MANTICTRCKALNAPNAKFCNQCGARTKMPLNITKFVDSMPEEYTKLDGLWEITTEGDCEGRSVRRLGIHEGNLVELAARFSNKNYYSLHFTAVSPTDEDDFPKILPKGGVSVTMDIKSETWDLSPAERALVAQEILNRNGYQDARAEQGRYYASFVLKSTDDTTPEDD